MRLHGSVKGFIDRIVDHLVNQVMKRLLIRATDIHARPTPDGFKPFQNLDIFCGITGII